MESIPQLYQLVAKNLDWLLANSHGMLDPGEVEAAVKVLLDLPIIEVKMSIRGFWKCEPMATERPVKFVGEQIWNRFWGV